MKPFGFVAVDKAKSPGVDPKQLAAELQKVSLQQSPLVLSSVVEKGSHVHSGPTSAGSSSVPSPGQPGPGADRGRLPWGGAGHRGKALGAQGWCGPQSPVV